VLGFGMILHPRLFAGIPVLNAIGQRLSPELSGGDPLGSADAVVTVLLLVPGLLLARLEIPSARSVLGRLRLFPRYVAYLAMIIAGALALCVAVVRVPQLELPFEIAIITLGVLILLVAADTVTKAVKRRSRVPINNVSPNWLVAEVAGPGRRRKQDCVVNFSTVGRDTRA
jgi:hypothetical protein